MGHRLIGLALAAAISVVSCATGLAQIKIKEKISITPKPRNVSNTVEGGGGQTGGVTSGFIMPKKGFFQLFYGTAERRNSYIPYTAKLAANRFRGNVTVFDTIWNRIQYYNSSQSQCISSQTFYIFSGLGQTVTTSMNVQKGDTVRLFYITDLDPVDGTPDTLFIAQADTLQLPGVWTLYFWKYDACINEPKEYISLTLAVTDTTIKFTPLVSNNVYPTYPGHNDNQTKNNTLDLELKVQFGDSLIKNHWVKVDTTVLVDSGGHSHGGARPMGKFLLPRTSPAGSYDTVRTFTRQTDSTGSIRFKFLASQFGGIERINAKRVSDTTSFDTLRLTTSVPGMLAFSGSGNYQLTGARPSHPNNHYLASQAAISSLINSANQFAGADWNATGLMRLNDMSLTYGGGFDVAGGWDYDIVPVRGRPGHRTHREGKSVDIENLQVEEVVTISQSTGKDTTFTIPKVKWIKKFKRFMEIDMGSWTFQDEGQLNSDIFKRTRKFPHFDWTGN